MFRKYKFKWIPLALPSNVGGVKRQQRRLPTSDLFRCGRYSSQVVAVFCSCPFLGRSTSLYVGRGPKWLYGREVKVPSNLSIFDDTIAGSTGYRPITVAETLIQTIGFLNSQIC